MRTTSVPPRGLGITSTCPHAVYGIVGFYENFKSACLKECNIKALYKGF
jgi:hypothetical protein